MSWSAVKTGVVMIKSPILLSVINNSRGAQLDVDTEFFKHFRDGFDRNYLNVITTIIACA